jgi:hypothetical protein
MPGKDDGIFVEPFRTAYIYFEKLIKEVDRIVIIGYSGRDAVIQLHLNEALEQRPDRELVIITKGQLSPELEALSKKASKEPVVLIDGVEDAMNGLVVDDGRILPKLRKLKGAT